MLSVNSTLAITFKNSYRFMPDDCYKESSPIRVAKPSLIAFNHLLADDLGIDCGNVPEAELAGVFAGNIVPVGARPVALAYSGHQFGHLNPRLGDGRALLLGDVVDIHGNCRDIQLKGSGPTPFTRGGDGRAAIGPVLREYIVSEAMHALGVPTTRALAAVSTGEWVYRQTPEPGAIFTRVAASHIRVGSFQYLALRQNNKTLMSLADYVIRRHFSHLLPHLNRPEAHQQSGEHYLEMFAEICRRQAKLIAHWMSLGFIHGVMNTDNTAVSGETIDYGPCAFIDTFDPAKVFSFIDEGGRYAWSNQPAIGRWNLTRLAETLVPIVAADRDQAVDSLTEILNHYPSQYQSNWLELMRLKLGLTITMDSDEGFIEELLSAMHKGGADFTLFFRRFCDLADAPEDQNIVIKLDQLFKDPAIWRTWFDKWRRRTAQEPTPPKQRAESMRAANPAIIPRNHRVAEVIKAAEHEQNYQPFRTLLEALRKPYQDQSEFAAYQQPPQAHEEIRTTYCGT